MAILTVNEVNSFYGEVQALHSVSFAIDEGQIVSVIGACVCIWAGRKLFK